MGHLLQTLSKLPKKSMKVWPKVLMALSISALVGTLSGCTDETQEASVHCGYTDMEIITNCGGFSKKCKEASHCVKNKNCCHENAAIKMLRLKKCGPNGEENACPEIN